MASVEPAKWRTGRTCQETTGKPPHGPECRCKVTKWRARWRNEAGRQRKQLFDSYQDAKSYGEDMEADKRRGRYVDPADSRVTFRAYAERWRKLQPHSEGTAHSVEQHLRLHVYPHIGDRPMGSIRPSEIQALVTKSKCAPSTTGVILGRVVAVFRSAVYDRVVPTSPCVGIKLPKAQGKVDRVMTTKQVVALADAMPAGYRSLVLAGAGTGLRPGELFGLTVSAVDFLRRDISVERQLVRVRGQGVELRPVLKSESSYRTVPVGEAIVKVLAAHLQRSPAHPELGLIFMNQRGGPIQQYPFSQAWATARRNAGLPDWVNGPHQLRHFYASTLIGSGASVKVVQRRLGHASAKTTLDTYGHMFPDDEEATRTAIDRTLGAALAPEFQAGSAVGGA